MMMKCVVTVFIACLLHFLGNAATYYVATNGNNAADGSAETPWLNVWKAASTATAGDTVIVGVGEFNEFVTNTVSGDAGNPITFTGTRGAAGEWLSIIDPSTIISNGWETAADIGSGVWKLTGLSFRPNELSIANKRVAFAYALGDMSVAIASAYDTNWQTGAELLALPSNVTVGLKATTGSLEFWSTINAMYCATGSVCYLRLRDGSDPNGLLIRASPNVGVSPEGITAANPAVNLNGQSYVVWSNLLVRGAFAGFLIASGHHNVIASNRITGGYAQVYLTTGTYQNTVSRNDLTDAYYGYDDSGAWSDGTTSNYVARASLYAMAKHLMGESSSHNDAIKLLDVGNSNVITGNYIYSGLGVGIAINGSTVAPTYSTELVANTIDGMPSVGILLSEGHTETKIYSNHVSDCNLSFRPHHWNIGSETNRIIYIYRNTCWLPLTVGNHFYFYFDETPSAYKPTLWCYQNSFSGGEGCISASTHAPDEDGLTNCYWLNNIMSDTKYYSASYYSWTNILMEFNYNLVTPPYNEYPPTMNFPPFFGANNITNGSQWFNAEGMSFALTNGSPAINAGMDIPTTYPDLPQDGTVKVGTAWDMGALEYGAGPILRVGNLFSAPK